MPEQQEVRPACAEDHQCMKGRNKHEYDRSQWTCRVQCRRGKGKTPSRPRPDFADVELRGVIGPCWVIRNLDEVWDDPDKREAILRIVRLLEREESLMGFSTHFISISSKTE